MNSDTARVLLSKVFGKQGADLSFAGSTPRVAPNIAQHFLALGGNPYSALGAVPAQAWHTADAAASRAHAEQRELEVSRQANVGSARADEDARARVPSPADFAERYPEAARYVDRPHVDPPEFVTKYRDQLELAEDHARQQKDLRHLLQLGHGGNPLAALAARATAPEAVTYGEDTFRLPDGAVRSQGAALRAALTAKEQPTRDWRAQLSQTPAGQAELARRDADEVRLRKFIPDLRPHEVKSTSVDAIDYPVSHPGPPPISGTATPPISGTVTPPISGTAQAPGATWAQSITANVTPQTIGRVLGAPARALKTPKADKPQPDLATKHDLNTKAWYENDMVRRAAMFGLAGGAGLGGIYALSKMFNRPKPKSKIDRNFDFTYPVERTKAGEEQDWSSYLWGSGDRKASILDNPLLLSTLALTGGGLLLGGYKGTQLLTDAVLKKTQDDERKKAQRDFHDALLSSYTAPLSHDPHVKKSSSAVMTEVGQALDSLYVALTQKTAEYPGLSTGSATGDILAGLPALYLLYAGATGLGTGALAYDYTRKGSKAEALKHALRERDSARYEHAPPELYATAEPVDISKPAPKKQQRSAVV